MFNRRKNRHPKQYDAHSIRVSTLEGALANMREQKQKEKADDNVAHKCRKFTLKIAKRIDKAIQRAANQGHIQYRVKVQVIAEETNLFFTDSCFIKDENTIQVGHYAGWHKFSSLSQRQLYATKMVLALLSYYNEQGFEVTLNDYPIDFHEDINVKWTLDTDSFMCGPNYYECEFSLWWADDAFVRAAGKITDESEIDAFDMGIPIEDIVRGKNSRDWKEIL